jgi:hypothetical protein
MLTRILTVSALSVLVLAGCSNATSESPPAAPAASTGMELLAEHGVATGDVRDVIEHLDATPLAERSADFMASVRPDALLISDATTEEPVQIPIPGDDFYLSVAPYIDGTHDCYFHSLTTCTGELSGEEIQMTVTTANGEVLVDQTTTTYANGFVGLWLPRDIEGTLRIEHDGLVAETAIATGPEDATCLTTMQLA